MKYFILVKAKLFTFAYKVKAKIMKFFRICLFYLGIILGMQSCEKKIENIWNVELKEGNIKVEIINISEKLYDKHLNIEYFRKEFPWFGGSDEFLLKEKDKQEIEIYNEAISKINIKNLEEELRNLFGHIKYYFPKFKEPKVCLYSSALQDILSPIDYDTENNIVFIDMSAFMGEGNPNYKGLDLYIQKTMSQSNIIPKISMVFAENIISVDRNKQKFIDLLIYEGKLMILQDAFLPNVSKELKINYTKEQYEWAIAYEKDIWNFFVENNLLFSEDKQLSERFIAMAPFSKFYTDIDRESSPRVGVFSGWRICETFFKANPDTKLVDFIKLDTETIFNKSLYKGNN